MSTALRDRQAARSATVGRRFIAHCLSGTGDVFLDSIPATASTFQTRRHIETVLETIGAAEAVDPVLIGVSDAAGKPLALFPFVLRRRSGLRVIEGLDLEVTDYFGPLWFDGEPPSAAEADVLWSAVVAGLPPADAVTFKKSPRLISGRPHALSNARHLKAMGADATTLVIRESTLHKHSLARRARKLGNLGSVSFDLATTPAEIAAALAALTGFRLQRFRKLGRPDALTRPDVVEFYRRMSTPVDSIAPGKLFTLRVDEEIVAVIYAFHAGDVFTVIIPAFSEDPRWNAHSLGLIAMFRALEWSVANGCRIFDLSVGSLHYKARFNADAVELFEHQEMLTPLGVIVVAEAWARRTIRHLTRRHPRVRAELQRIRSQWPRLWKNPNA
jgi:CelD/BcsL family acetyltransferase involved in cellulose biosynthesis